MENNSYGDIIGSAQAPYINSLASQCGKRQQLPQHHPPQPAELHGSHQRSKPVGARSLLPRLFPPVFFAVTPPGTTCSTRRPRGRHTTGRWRRTCDKQGTSIYADRHNPAIYYTDLKNCSTNDVPLGTTSSSPLLKAFSSNSTAPAFSFVTPNLCDDMHGVPGVCLSLNLPVADGPTRGSAPGSGSSPRRRSTSPGDTAVFVAGTRGGGGSGRRRACAANTIRSELSRPDGRHRSRRSRHELSTCGVLIAATRCSRPPRISSATPSLAWPRRRPRSRQLSTSEPAGLTWRRRRPAGRRREGDSNPRGS